MRYIALLRGINVGGNTMIKMSELKTGLETVGLENVATYINSGNIAFDSKKSAEERFVAKLERAISERFDKTIAVMVREQLDITRIIGANPYAGEYESHKQMHVLFLQTPLPPEKAQLLIETDFGEEKFMAIGREVYGLLPDGVAESTFSKKAILDKKPRVIYTGRNIRTVERLGNL